MINLRAYALTALPVSCFTGHHACRPAHIPTDPRWLVAFSMECQQTPAAYPRHEQRERKDAPHLTIADRVIPFHFRGRTFPRVVSRSGASYPGAPRVPAAGNAVVSEPADPTGAIYRPVLARGSASPSTDCNIQMRMWSAPDCYAVVVDHIAPHSSMSCARAHCNNNQAR